MSISWSVMTYENYILYEHDKSTASFFFFLMPRGRRRHLATTCAVHISGQRWKLSTVYVGTFGIAVHALNRYTTTATESRKRDKSKAFYSLFP